MLKDNTRVVVVDPPPAYRLRKWHAQCCARDEYGIGYGEGDSVAREHCREVEVEDVAIGFKRANVCADSKEEYGHPEQRKEALIHM